jgi:hypothetical protein
VSSAVSMVFSRLDVVPEPYACPSFSSSVWIS